MNSGDATEALAPGAAVESSSWQAEDRETEPAETVAGSTWPHKAVKALSPCWVRAVVISLWVILGAAGLSCASSFLKVLESNVPPCPGTASKFAAEAYEQFFPAQPLQAAFLIKSQQNGKLVDFVGESTCNISHNVSLDALPTLKLSLACHNPKALGSGCLRNIDIEPQMELVAVNIANSLLKNIVPPRKRKKMTEQIVKEIKALTPRLLAQLPFNTTLCPVATALTDDWLKFTGSLAGKLNSSYPDQYVIKEKSISSIPDIGPITKTFPLPDALSKQLKGLINVTNISIEVPAGQLWQLLAHQFLASDYSTSLAALSISDPDPNKTLLPAGEAAQAIGLSLDTIADTAPTTLNGQASSLGVMLHFIQAGINKVMDVSAMTVPLALLILACMVRSLKLLLIVLPNIVIVICASILVMYPYASNVTCSTTVPALMVAVDLAMSVDYSLFMLTRFQKEIQSGRPAHEAVAFMLGTSGRIVFVSGLTLLICFLCMLSLPVSFVNSIGVAAALTVFMAVMASLTLTPALLLTCPTFFSTNWPCGTSCWHRVFACQKPLPVVGEALQRGTLPRSVEDEVREVNFRQEAVESAETKSSCWPQFGTQIQRGAWIVAVALLAIVIPVAVTSLPRLTQSVGLLPLMPSDAASTTTLLDLTSTFGVGSVFPTQLVVVPPAGLTNDTERSAWLQSSCEELGRIAEDVNSKMAEVDDSKSSNLPPFTSKAFAGVMILNGNCVKEGSGLSLGTWSHVDHPYSATTIMMSYQIDPFSVAGSKWVKALRNAITRSSARNLGPSASAVTTWHVYGIGPTQIDASDATFAKLPLMFGLMMAVVFVVISVAMKSLIAPLRAVFCLLWMLAITYGLAVFVFQDGMLSFLNWPQLGARTSGSMSWLSPAVASSVMVGLGLDYDIFYSERVIEEWKHGYSEREAAARALGATANIISAAGVIMVVAFLGLLLGATPVLNEIAFLLIVGVIIDCFITTKIIIPCVMALLGKANFWPRKRAGMPQVDGVSMPPAV